MEKTKEKEKCYICLHYIGQQHASTCFKVGMVMPEDCVSKAEDCLPKEDGMKDGIVDIAVRSYDGSSFPPHDLTDTHIFIKNVCDDLADFLINKNRKYGNSAIYPQRIFSKASPLEQINVRLDDKISRLISSQPDDTEDAEQDLLGYLILKRVIQKHQKLTTPAEKKKG